MPRTVEEIEDDIRRNLEQRDALAKARTALMTELNAAKIAARESNPHPWLGKKLKRSVTNWKGVRTQTGTLTVYDGKSRFRANYSRAGDLIVVSKSGLTSYSFDEPNVATNRESAWELAE